MAAGKPDKKEKKDKKRSDESGVAKTKKDKKEKKEKKDKLATAAEDQLQKDAAKSAPAVTKDAVDSVESDVEVETAEVTIEKTVVSFAVPLADEKGTKKVYKTIRKSAKANTLKRGVKEVVKTLRKSAASAPNNTSFPGVVIIAGDISPADVISHIPVLCEDHNVPFMFVSSRAELGAAAKTKRPTSVVMVMEKRDGKKKEKEKKKDAAEDDKEDDGEGFAESYAGLVKYVQKELAKQAFWSKGESKA